MGKRGVKPAISDMELQEIVLEAHRRLVEMGVPVQRAWPTVQDCIKPPSQDGMGLTASANRVSEAIKKAKMRASDEINLANFAALACLAGYATIDDAVRDIEWLKKRHVGTESKTTKLTKKQLRAIHATRFPEEMNSTAKLTKMQLREAIAVAPTQYSIYNQLPIKELRKRLRISLDKVIEKRDRNHQDTKSLEDLMVQVKDMDRNKLLELLNKYGEGAIGNPNAMGSPAFQTFTAELNKRKALEGKPTEENTKEKKQIK